MMFRWLNTPHVSKWWDIDGKKNPSQEDVDRHYLPRINGQDSTTTCYLIIYNGTPIGYIQSCSLNDFPSAKAAFDLEHDCAGIDIFIGEEEYVYRGFGSIIIKKFLHDVLFVEYDVPCCIIDPDLENKAAIKAYNKAGFKYIKTVWNSEDNVYAYLMSVDRAEFSIEEEEEVK